MNASIASLPLCHTKHGLDEQAAWNSGVQARCHSMAAAAAEFVHGVVHQSTGPVITVSGDWTQQQW